jgi:hypothetical protein
MQHIRRVAFPSAALSVSLALSALSALSAVTLGATLPDVPEKLKAPTDQALAVELQAAGFQVYVCGTAQDDATRFVWTLKAPEADLFDASGKKIGKHYGGPTWEANDGSKVVGEVKARDDGPDPAAIPWLLLSAKATSGSGILSKTASVQRLRTVGGKAPVAGCNQPAHAGTEVRVPYTATYYFYAAKP